MQRRMISGPFNLLSSHQVELEQNYSKFSKVGKSKSFQKNRAIIWEEINCAYTKMQKLNDIGAFQSSHQVEMEIGTPNILIRGNPVLYYGRFHESSYKCWDQTVTICHYKCICFRQKVRHLHTVEACHNFKRWEPSPLLGKVSWTFLQIMRVNLYNSPI